MNWTRFALIVSCVVISGCATPFERHLGTIPGYHAVLKSPVLTPGSGNSLPDGPDYLIGIEKADADVVEKLPLCPSDSLSAPLRYCLHLNEYPRDSPWRKKIVEQQEHGKTLFVSHIARFDSIDNPIGGKRVCFLYNVYPSNEFPDAADCVPPFAAQSHLFPLSVTASLTALEELEQELDERIGREPAAKKPTHVLIMSTGWNTLQMESIDNYRHWTSHLKQAAQDETRPFHPLVIGVSWPSEWPLISSWLGPVISVFDKEHDADEVGYVTVNALVHSVLDKVKRKHNLQIVMIGHSFGGRAMATAANSRPLLFRNMTSRPTAALMVGLQPAFSIQRFGGGNQGNPYQRFFAGSQKYILTSSANDWILKLVSITNPVGSSRGLTKAKEFPERFQVVPLDREGRWVGMPSSDPCHLAVLDASETINGHHDVYGAAVGRILWNAIRSFAPALSWPGASSGSGQELRCAGTP